MNKPRKLTIDEAAAVHWFLNHLCFEDYLASIPPHLPKDVRTDKAYEIRDALAALQQHVPSASAGDWMYRLPPRAATAGSSVQPTGEQS